MAHDISWKRFIVELEPALVKALATTDISLLVKLHDKLGYEYKEANPIASLGWRRWLLELSEYAYDCQL